MAKIPVMAALPPIFFAAIAGLFLSGMVREDPDILPSTLVGKPAPSVVLEPLEGLAPFTDSQLKEPEPKLVNFWASWCAPCRVEHPQFMALQAEGLTIYGVNFKDEPRKALRFLDELGNPYEGVGGDPDGRMALEWGVYGIPETFVVDGDGEVILRFAGPVTESILRRRIRPALEQALAE